MIVQQPLLASLSLLNFRKCANTKSRFRAGHNCSKRDNYWSSLSTDSPVNGVQQETSFKETLIATKMSISRILPSSATSGWEGSFACVGSGASDDHRQGLHGGIAADAQRDTGLGHRAHRNGSLGFREDQGPLGSNLKCKSPVTRHTY